MAFIIYSEFDVFWLLHYEYSSKYSLSMWNKKSADIQWNKSVGTMYVFRGPF